MSRRNSFVADRLRTGLLGSLSRMAEEGT
jgi:hypothetical protein